MLGRRIAAQTRPPATVRDLEIALLEEWNSIPQSLIDNLIASMANRVITAMPTYVCFSCDLILFSRVLMSLLSLPLPSESLPSRFLSKPPERGILGAGSST
ncbi:hypothetical protein TNCV_2177801 [Trichonephila clavipes]|uniref:Uncharacterized protein n=1 Tax=Trichonephila clavipes TaxID=2585209 RepID=A0A8X7B8U1_TRICX|nr:hypothetical protein TNCV_2177801 [Trichonephila clavipes]